MKIRMHSFGVTKERCPLRLHENDAGADVYMPFDCTLNPGDIIKVPLGFGVEIPDGFCFLASNFPHFHRYDSLKSALYIHAVSKNINTFPKNQGRIRAAIAVEILDFTVMYR